MNERTEVLIKMMNQFFDLRKKLVAKSELNSFQRTLDRINDYFGELGLTMHDPVGEQYDETRTDCEANIAGITTDKLIISEVIKPIIYFCSEDNRNIIVQRGVVIVQSV
jgi:hypothetical protein